MNLSLYLILLIFIISANSLSFYLDPGSTKCLSEDVPKKELIVGDFLIQPQQVPGVSIRVLDPMSTILYQKQSETDGKFAFTATLAGEYKTCFTNSGNQQRTISFNLATGVNAKDYTEVAKKESLKPIEVELKRLEDLIKETHEVMVYLKKREESMRNTNESTNYRVLNFSLFAMFVLVALGVWQIRHLSNFFRTKKLIN